MFVTTYNILSMYYFKKKIIVIKFALITSKSKN